MNSLYSHAVIPLFHQCPRKFSALNYFHQRSLGPLFVTRFYKSAVHPILENFGLFPSQTFLTKPFSILQSSHLLNVHSNVSPGSQLQCFCHSLNCKAIHTNTVRRFTAPGTMSASPRKLFFPNPEVSPNPRKRQNMPRPITVCIEGNIGSGKTTLLNRLAVSPGVEVLEEPVHKWRNVRGKNLLDLMYSDPVRWSHLFQTYVQLTMMQLHLKPSTAKVKIMERSIHSARHCFVENLFQTGRMSEPEYNVYCEWYSTITDNLDIPVDLIVYLSASPSVAQERIRQRGREEEAKIPLSYLTELHELHRDWLSSETSLPAPLLVLPSDMTLEQMTKTVEEHIALLLRPSPDVSHTRPPAAAVYAGVSPSHSPSKLAAGLLPASASN